MASHPTTLFVTLLLLTLHLGASTIGARKIGYSSGPNKRSKPAGTTGLPRWATAHIQQVTETRTNRVVRDPYSIIGADNATDDVDPSLEFYAQVEVGTSDIGIIVSPLDSNTTNSFGEVEAFALNVTSGYETTSTQLGTMRGYTVQTSSTSTSHAVEVEVLQYDDGAGTSGTISLQGHITSSADEIAIVGGSGSFRGVRGYDVITYINASSAAVFVYHHALYFLS
mgnify:CR=1 FL=1